MQLKPFNFAKVQRESETENRIFKVSSDNYRDCEAGYFYTFSRGRKKPFIQFGFSIAIWM